MTPEQQAKLDALFAASRVRVEQSEKLETLATKAKAKAKNLRLQAQFLSVADRLNLGAELRADELSAARLRDEANWATIACVVQGQWQHCNCGHTADATVGIFARQQHLHDRTAFRLREVETIPDNIPLERQWTSTHLRRCIRCADADVVDDLVARFTTIHNSIDQLPLF